MNSMPLTIRHWRTLNTIRYQRIDNQDVFRAGAPSLRIRSFASPHILTIYSRPTPSIFLTCPSSFERYSLIIVLDSNAYPCYTILCSPRKPPNPRFPHLVIPNAVRDLL